MNTRNLTRVLFVLLTLSTSFVFAQAPFISGISIDSGLLGTTINITGSNLGSSSNVVRIGNAKANIVAASSTSLTVTSDTGSVYGAISVTNVSSGLTGMLYTKYFNPTFVHNYFYYDSITFTNMNVVLNSGTQPYTALAGDLDGDGLADVVVNCKGTGATDGAIYIYKNNYSGGGITASSFSAPTIISTGGTLGNFPTNIKMVDLDGDGKLDLLFSMKGSRRLAVLRNTSSVGSISFDAGNFYYGPFLNGPSVVNYADYNADGKMDIAVSSNDTGNVAIMLNHYSGGTWGTSAFDSGNYFNIGSANISMVTADFDGDLKPDFAVVDSTSKLISIYRNISSGGTLAFASPVQFNSGNNPVDIQAGDLNGDGKMDLIVTNSLSDSVSLFQNNSSTGTISFASRVSFHTQYPVGAAICDLNGDGKLDFAVTNTVLGQVSVYENIGTPGGTISTSYFSLNTQVIAGTVPIGVTAGDVNNDGYPDLIVGNRNIAGTGKVSILVNYPIPVIAPIVGDTSFCFSAGSSDYTDSITGGYWYLSNTTVATINATGHLTFITPGIDTIYYTVTKGGDTNRVYKVVRIDGLPHVSAISGTLVTCPGGHTTLSDTASGGKWYSSNSSVVTIDSVTGVTTGVAVGGSLITYRLINVCGRDSTTDSFHVTTVIVVPSISGSAAPLCVGDSVLLSDSLSGGSWSSSDTTIATVSSTGVVRAVRTGSATIVYSYSTICGTSSASRSVVVANTPVAGVISGSTSVCQGANTTFTDASAGGVWSSDDATIATVSSTGVVRGVGGGSTIISYTVTSSCGASAVAIKGITVNPLPVAGRPIAGASSVCVGSNISLSDTSHTGSWSSSNTSIATVTTGGVVRGVAAGSVNIRYIVTNACGSDTAVKAVTVATTPVAGTISGSSTLCVGTSSTYTTTGTSGSWSVSDSTLASVSAAGVVTGLSAGTDTLLYTVSNACSTAVARLVLTINSVPDAGTISGQNYVCPGIPVGLSTTGSGGNWISTNTAIATVSATGRVSAVTVTGGADTILYVVTNTCGSDTATFPITVQRLPATGTISGASNICVHASTTLTETATGGKWYSGSPTVATVDSNTGSVTGVSTGAVNISYTIRTVCGSFSAVNSMSILDVPVATLVGSTAAINLCRNAVTTLKATPVGSGSWYSAHSNVSLSGHGATSTFDSINVTGITVAADTVYYIARNICGTDTSAGKIINVRALPDAGTIVGPTHLCVGDTATVTDTAAGGRWYSPSTLRMILYPDGAITTFASGYGTVYYIASSTYCGLDTATLVIRIDNRAYAGSITGTDTLCPGGTTTLSDGSGGFSMTWYSSDTSIARVDPTSGDVTGTGVGSVTIYIVDSVVGCNSDTAFFPMTIRIGAPYAGIIYGNDTLCLGNGATYLDSVSGGHWYSSNTTVVTIDSMTGIAAANRAGAATITYTLSNSCGTGVASKVVRVYGKPNFTSSLTPAPICDSLLFNLALNSDSTPVSAKWIRYAVPNIANVTDSGTGAINEYLDLTSNTQANTKYYVTLSYHGCTRSDSITVGVKPVPRLLGSLYDTICSGEAFLFYDSTNTGAGTAATWTMVAPSTISASASSGSGNINDILTLSGASSASVMYIYSLTFNGCSNTENMYVVVNPSPGQPNISTHCQATVCQGSLAFNFGTDSPATAGVYYNWSATNADIYAKGIGAQYCLVNFNNEGTAVIHLSAYYPGSSCTTSSDYIVNVTPGNNPTQEVIWFGGNFICKNNEMDTYQWGYDDKNTLDSTLLFGETNQAYYCPTINYNKYYWVMTSKYGCTQKSYYIVPTSVVNVNAAGEAMLSVAPNPNNGQFSVQFEDVTTSKAQIIISNVLGQTVYSNTIVAGTPMNIDAPLENGMYNVTIVAPSGKYVTRFIKE